MSASIFSSFASKLGLSTSVSRGPDGSPELEEDEVMQLVASPVDLVLGSDTEAGAGTLYISTRRVIWSCLPAAAPAADAAPAAPAEPLLLLALQYQQIMMHAISRDATASSRPCIYLQLDDGSEDMAEGSDSEEAEQSPDPEVRFIPQDPETVQDIFKALCDCAALNPDPEAEGEGDFFFDEAEVLRGLDDEEQAAALARQAGTMELEEGREELGELIGQDPSRFEDDEEEEVEEGEEMAEGAAPEPHGNGHLHGSA